MFCGAKKCIKIIFRCFNEYQDLLTFSYFRFLTECEITCMTYISKHRVYLVFCSDLTLRVFTDANSNFVEVECIPCLSTTLWWDGLFEYVFTSYSTNFITTVKWQTSFTKAMIKGLWNSCLGLTNTKFSAG